MFNVLKKSNKPVTQREPLPGQVKNNAGGYSFKVSDWEQFKRFLILGTTGGTYYVSQKDLTDKNLDVVKACVDQDPAQALELVKDVSINGRAPNNDAAIYVLALLASQKQPSADGQTEPTQVARDAFAALPLVCRTFTHMSHFMQYFRQMKLRGMGRAFQRGIAGWYNSKQLHELVHQLIKFQNRDGWSQHQVYRLLLPNKFIVDAAPPEENSQLSASESLKIRKQIYDSILYTGDKAFNYDYLVKANDKRNPLTRLAFSKELLHCTDPTEALRLMKEYKLPMESVPTQLRTKEVYETAIHTNGLTWLARNVGAMSAKGLTDPFSPTIAVIREKFADEERIKKERLHPLEIAKAAWQYQQGKGDKGSLTWTVNPEVQAGLVDAFYKSFKYVEPSGKRILIAVDVSASMSNAYVQGIVGMKVHEAAGILALVAIHSEPHYHMMAYDYASHGHNGMHELNLHKGMRLPEIVQVMGKFRGGGTDCSIPFRYLLNNNIDCDVVVCLTDNETWAGGKHPITVLNEYRRKVGHRVKAINVSMASNPYSIFDQTSDPDSLEVVGFDTQLPQVISSFASF